MRRLPGSCSADRVEAVPAGETDKVVSVFRRVGFGSCKLHGENVPLQIRHNAELVVRHKVNKCGVDRTTPTSGLTLVIVSEVPARAGDENIAHFVAELLQRQPLTQRNRRLVARKLRAIVEELPPAPQREMSQTSRHLLEVADALDATTRTSPSDR